MDGQCIDVVSTSATTADATPVVLSETERMRFRFVPTIVDNQSSLSVQYGEKSFLSESLKMISFSNRYGSALRKNNKRNGKKGDWIELELHSKETYNLFMGLKGYMTCLDAWTEYHLVQHGLRRLIVPFQVFLKSSAAILLQQE